MMRVAFRVDASTRIGTGHARRCISLAAALRRAGSEVTLVTRDLDVSLPEIVARDIELPVHVLPAASDVLPSEGPAHASWAQVSWERDARETCEALALAPPDWLVVDHYAFDRRWHEHVQAQLGARLCVIDDLADRPLRGDLLVDHNLGADDRTKYAAVASGFRKLLGGPRFALLSQVYRRAPRYRFQDEVHSIGIFLGGADSGGHSVTALHACRDVAGFRGRIQVVTTTANPDLERLRAECASLDAELLVDLADLSAFFARHDLQIGAGGGAALERCCVGAPALALVCAANQEEVVAHLVAAGAVRGVRENTVAAIGMEVSSLLADPRQRLRMCEATAGLVDGRGAERVAVAMSADHISLRNATAEDATLAHGWRNDTGTRRFSRDPREISIVDHVAWWSRVLEDPARHLLIASCGEIAVGVLRIDEDADSGEVSIYLDPGLVGLGLGPSLLRAGQHWIRQRNPSLRRLRAEILEINRASAAIFAGAGFERVDETHWKWEIRS
jgi:UDP-2,4-diacetamido-2,4,6-trideoxy-beta-L-altropyranose hydrolase